MLTRVLQQVGAAGALALLLLAGFSAFSSAERSPGPFYVLAASMAGAAARLSVVGVAIAPVLVPVMLWAALKAFAPHASVSAMAMAFAFVAGLRADELLASLHSAGAALLGRPPEYTRPKNLPAYIRLLPFVLALVSVTRYVLWGLFLSNGRVFQKGSE